jgi:hypothetical protein
MFSVDDSLLVGNINTTKKITEMLSDASTEVGLDEKIERGIYMSMSHDHTARPYHNI